LVVGILFKYSEFNVILEATRLCFHLFSSVILYISVVIVYSCFVITCCVKFNWCYFVWIFYFTDCSLFRVSVFSVPYVFKWISLWGLFFFIVSQWHKIQRKASLFTYSLIESSVMHCPSTNYIRKFLKIY
jgi:hypothetical protein